MVSIKKYHTIIDEWPNMRAMNIPTRMGVIDKAARNLIKKVNSLCPRCGRPGFDVVKLNAGLPCSLCGTPTRSIVNSVLVCEGCDYSEIHNYPDSGMYEDPKYCDLCNP
jgi:ribosomal protein L37E